MNESRPQRRIPYGELIAFAALIVSAFGVWIAWKSSNRDEPTRVIEQRTSIPLTLRGRTTDEGRSLEIQPIESSHALQTLTIAAGASKIELGSDGELAAKALENALGNSNKEGDGARTVRVRIEARYVEAGADKSASGSYILTYKWEGGGLLGGRSLRLAGLSKG